MKRRQCFRTFAGFFSLLIVRAVCVGIVPTLVDANVGRNLDFYSAECTEELASGKLGNFATKRHGSHLISEILTLWCSSHDNSIRKAANQKGWTFSILK